MLKGHTAPVHDLAVPTDSPGGMRIVSASEDGTGRIWTIAPGAAAATSAKTG